MHFTTEKVTSKCDFLSLKQVYAHFCTALYMVLYEFFTYPVRLMRNLL